jgi:hypothetical protein
MGIPAPDRTTSGVVVIVGCSNFLKGLLLHNGVLHKQVSCEFEGFKLRVLNSF